MPLKTVRGVAAWGLALLGGSALGGGTEAQPSGEGSPRTPSLKQIMSDPEWVARSPSGAYWSWDGISVIYSLEKEQSRLTRRWRVPVSRGEAGAWEIGEHSVIADSELPFATSWGGSDSPDGALRVFTRSGDIFVRDLTTGELSQLTRTTASESSAMFMADGSVGFRRGGAWFARDMATGSEWQMADIRFEDEPSDDDEEGKEDDRDHLEAQQHRLFEIVRDREARSEERDSRNDRLREADTTRVPGPFYIGKGWRAPRRSLSPSGRWMVLVIAKDKGDEPRDEMPAYVNEDGYVSSSSVRPKVGEENRRNDKLVVLDLEAETVHRVSLETLPLISDDPLAWLTDNDKKTNDLEGANKAEGEGAAEGDSEGDGDRPDEREASPRPVQIERVEWSSDGSVAAIQIHSNDNKDRWIASIDFGDTDSAGAGNDTEGESSADDGIPSLRVLHHLRDEAWINWRYNEMGWTLEGRTLWFLSEESGFSHLYAWDAGTGETMRLTGKDGSDRFTIQDVSESPEGGVLYYRSNRTHPGVYELERVSVASGEHEIMTSLEGTVEAYDISPNGDQIIVRHSTAMDPPELYVLGAQPEADPARLTETDTELYRSFEWVEPRWVEVPSSHVADPIHTRVYNDPSIPAPSGAGKPVVVFAHGAGYTQHVYDGWSYYFREHMFHTLLCRQGYIVVAPDFRASAGYGRDWRTAIYRDMGRPELEDFDDCLAWVGQNYDADLDNVGIYGGSYGGFLSLMAMFQRPEVYDAGAALRSVTDWAHYNHSYTSNILNTPEIDPVAFERSSPIEHAEGLEGALLMCHGMLDDNVVAQDTIRLAQRLIELEKEDWEMALYPIEPHGFQEPTGWLDEYRRILKLFETHLKD